MGMQIRFINPSGYVVHKEEWGWFHGFPGQTADGRETVRIDGVLWTVLGLQWVLSDPESNIPTPYINIFIE